jgi:hypothetical protein
MIWAKTLINQYKINLGAIPISITKLVKDQPKITIKYTLLPNKK